MPGAPVLTADIVRYCDDLLDVARYRDYGPNGLQVPGPAEVRHVVTGVSAHAELFAAARKLDADLVLAHHGLFWGAGTKVITPMLKARLQALFDGNIALAAYHLPLDGHPEIGNNALLADALGCESHVPFGVHDGAPIGVAGTFPDRGLTADDLVAQVTSACGGREPLTFLEGPEQVRRIGIISGAATDHVSDAVDAGLDAFLTGEPAERVMAIARELGIHVLCAGHHATETRGIRTLGDRVAARFGVKHTFVDIPNPI